MTIRAILTALLGVLLVAIAWAGDELPVRLAPFLAGLEFPDYLTHDGTKRLFVVEQRGRIRLVVDGQLAARPYLDITDRVDFGGECGLLGLAFHPDFARNGRFFVNYTTHTGEKSLHTHIAEFHADPNATEAAAATERIVLRFAQPWRNHNGGQVLFGPDGMFYIGTGDGGLGGDPLDNGQHLDTLLGKILRLDVDGPAPYGVPRDNPFVQRAGARSEIWAYGLRNPWRFSFDRLTGMLYCADVGQDHWEEVDLIAKGGNYGWNIMEGTHLFKPAGRATEGLIPPIKEYGHDMGNCIIGGYVYRGREFPSLRGWYLYADYGSGRVWGLKHDGHTLLADRQLLKTDASICSFGEDLAGELYACDHQGGAVWRVVAVTAP